MRHVLPLAFLIACNGGPVTVVTYNAGLAVGFVDGARERADGVADEIAGFDADVVCLQEVWLPEQIAAVEQAAADAFPHQAFPDAQPDVLAAPACAADDLDDVLACAETECADACLDELADCLIGSCALRLATLPLDCQRCAFAQIGDELDAIVQTCTTSDVRFANGGSFGTGLLSREPLRDVEEIAFTSALIRRGAVHAVADTPAGPVDVYCTHLAADLSPLPYTDPEGTGWADENEAQVEALLDWIDDTATTGRVVVMGDMNTGPAGEGLVAELPQSWSEFDRSGLAVPFVDQVGDCTLCPENPLRGEGADPTLIDHVLLDGFDGGATAERVMEQAFSLETCEGTIDAAWSDHYGVRVTATP